MLLCSGSACVTTIHATWGEGGLQGSKCGGSRQHLLLHHHLLLHQLLLHQLLLHQLLLVVTTLCLESVGGRGLGYSQKVENLLSGNWTRDQFLLGVYLYGAAMACAPAGRTPTPCAVGGQVSEG